MAAVFQSGSPRTHTLCHDTHLRHEMSDGTRKPPPRPRLASLGGSFASESQAAFDIEVLDQSRAIRVLVCLMQAPHFQLKLLQVQQVQQQGPPAANSQLVRSCQTRHLEPSGISDRTSCRIRNVSAKAHRTHRWTRNVLPASLTNRSSTLALHRSSCTARKIAARPAVCFPQYSLPLGF